MAIVQARMGSTRLPRKVLADIQGHPMLWYVIHRARAATTVDEVVVATTTQSRDQAIVDFCRENGVSCFRGREEDVLDRYYQAALEREADVVVRITSDCPLIDPSIIDKVVRSFLLGQCDYASNVMVRTYPRGLDTEVMTLRALEQAWINAGEPYQRVHVTPYIYENPSTFRLLSVTGDGDYSQYRWTVDTEQDLELVRAVYTRLKGRECYLDDVLKLMDREPGLADINRAIAQKSLREG
ncbi:MAG: cytidylyltransferase domain-containing protein [Terriglobales bacterium]